MHCEAGVSRSGALATAWLMRAERLSFWTAVGRVRARRPRVLPNVGFASQLQALERRLGIAAPPGPSSLARYLRTRCCVPAEIEVIDELLVQHEGHAPRALRALFGGEIPRVVQGAR